MPCIYEIYSLGNKFQKEQRCVQLVVVEEEEEEVVVMDWWWAVLRLKDEISIDF